jgi:hypothetical protein
MRIHDFLAAPLAVGLALVAGMPARPDQPAEESVSARVEGTVRSAGKPMAGVKIRLLTMMDSGKVSCTSDARGAFRMTLDRPHANFGTMVAASDDGTMQGMGKFKSADFHRKLDLELKPSFAVKVRVIDAHKSPVAGAGVLVTEKYFPLLAAQTDEQGSVTIRIPAEAQVWWIMGLKAGVGFDYFENYSAYPPPKSELPPAEVMLTLNGARSISVESKDVNGKPLPGLRMLPITIQKKGKITYANLSGASLMPGAAVRSDQLGIARFDWIPSDLSKNGFFFQSAETEYDCTDYARFDPAQETRTLVARFARPTIVNGKVFAPDGKPIAGVLIYAARNGRAAEARTAADGTYRLEVHGDETYRIAVFDDNWAAPARWVLVNRKWPPTDVDFQLGEGTLVHGTVTSEPDGKPMVGSLLVQDSQAGESARWVSIDQDGGYKVRLAPGEYFISLGTNKSQVETIAVGSEKTIRKDLRLKQPQS